MDPTNFVEIVRQGLVVLIKISAPIMIISLVVGLAVSLFQALTQIQEMTLTFVPKVAAIFICLIFFMPFMLSTLMDFTHELMERVEHVEQSE